MPLVKDCCLNKRFTGESMTGLALHAAIESGFAFAAPARIDNVNSGSPKTGQGYSLALAVANAFSIVESKLKDKVMR